MNCKHFFGSETFKMHYLVICMDKVAKNVFRQNFEISYSEFLILMILESDNSVSQKDIADHLNQTEAVVSRHVDSLVQRGFLNRTEDKKNRRKNILEITQKASLEMEKAYKILILHSENLFENIDKENRENLNNLLNLMIENYHLQNPKPKNKQN